MPTIEEKKEAIKIGKEAFEIGKEVVKSDLRKERRKLEFLISFAAESKRDKDWLKRDSFRINFWLRFLRWHAAHGSKGQPWRKRILKEGRDSIEDGLESAGVDLLSIRYGD